MPHVFVSYSRTDQDYARKLAEDLRQHGFDVWIDDRIDYGDQWFNEIVKAVEGCGAFVIVMSPDAEKSKWVQREILLAQRRDKPIYPMLLRGEEFPLLIDIQFVDVRHGGRPDADFYARLQNVLQPADESGQMVAPVEPEMPQPQSSGGMPRGLLAMGALLGVIVVAALAGILLLGGGDDAEPEATQIGVSEALSTLGSASTETATSTPTETTVAIIIPTDTRTPFGTATNIPSSTHTLTNTPAPTDTPTPTFTVTNTPAPTLTPTQADVALGFTPVSSNAAWTPVIQDFDGVEMVLVPAGCFMMGSEDGRQDERPVHEQCFEAPFWIDRYEVTNEQYGSIGCESSSSEPNQPRNCVDWFDASAHCEGRGTRLPTEREWEYAARGPDNWAYPWGNDFIADNGVFIENSNRHTATVGSKPSGASWVGVMDMSGNVWEWASTIYEVYPYTSDREDGSDTNRTRVLRGGGFSSSTDGLRAAFRNFNADPEGANIISGFRCAHSS